MSCNLKTCVCWPSRDFRGGLSCERHGGVLCCVPGRRPPALPFSCGIPVPSACTQLSAGAWDFCPSRHWTRRRSHPEGGWDRAKHCPCLGKPRHALDFGTRIQGNSLESGFWFLNCYSHGALVCSGCDESMKCLGMPPLPRI